MKLCRALMILAVLLTAYSFVILAMMVPWVFAAIVIGLIALAAKGGYIRLTAFGTARWADADDLRKTGMLDGEGLIVGRIAGQKSLKGFLALFNPRVDSSVACQQFLALWRKPEPSLVRLTKAVHTAVFAPTGVGKGVSCVIPFLQTCPDSCVVLDFKGENARLTAKFRQEVFGHTVKIIDPFRVTTQTPDSFNPLDFIDKDSSVALDEIRGLAEALVLRTGKEHEVHWADSAEIWIAAMIAVVVLYGETDDRSLQTVRGLLSKPAEMEAVIKLMCDSPAWDGMLSRLGHQLTQFKDKELGSTLTTTNRFLRFLDTIAIAESTKGSSFDPADLLTGKMTVYLILPPEHMRAQSALLRMWIGSLLRAVVRGGLQERKKVHFILDEAASLGHMDALDDAVDKFRGYGIRLQLYYQSLGQLKKCWPEGQEQTLLSNTTQVFFGTNDNDTAKYVSDRLGEATIIVDSGGTSSGQSHQVSEQNGQGSTSYSWNTSSNWQQQARRLLKPEEVMALPERTAITFAPKIPPVATTLVRYFEERNLGQGPGWFKRVWSGVTIWAAAVFLIGLAGSLAVLTTNAAHRDRVIPYSLTK